MKSLVASLLIVFAASQSLAAGEYVSCMQTRTNDPFLPNLVTLYVSEATNTLRVKFQIDGDERLVAASAVTEDDSVIQFGNVRLIEDGVVKGGPIGIKFFIQKSVFANKGQLLWKYFDGAEATYACSVN
ncbi:hypothetical protein ACLVWU_04865 [Bdellovibrio sp. HCB290]|uniref:hypothetical protein n=1 Tax=Bdellovibrio sp. HCB290 TaxID=3394356 RepID=UPI0039B3EFAD